MSKLLAMMMKPKNYMYATIKGTLTENDGVFSGFSGINFLQTQDIFDANQNFEIKVEFTTGNSINTEQFIFSNKTSGTRCGLSIYTNSRFVFYTNDSNGNLKSNSSSKNILPNTKYVFYCKCENNTMTWFINNIQQGSFAVNYSSYVSSYLTLGTNKLNSSIYFTGSIDLNQSYIKINNTKYQLQAVVGYTVVGSPTIVDGVVSGFSASNYLELNKSLNLSTEKVEIVLDIKLTSFSNDGLCILSANNGLNIQLYRQSTQYKLLNLGGNANSGTKQFVLNTNYKVKFVITSTTLDMYVWENNNWILDVSYTVNYTTISNIVIGDNYTHSGTRVFTGSIDLNETYIKVNNKLWFNGQPA